MNNKVIFSMVGVGKVYPPNKQVLRDIYLSYFYGAKIVNLKSKVKSPYAPFVTSPSALATGANTYSFKLSYSTAPGLYELRVPVTQNDWTSGTRVSTTKVAKFRFQVLANKKVSKKVSYGDVKRFTLGKTGTFTLTAPTYQRGAKVTMYFKKKGSKSFTKVKTAKLKGKASAYKSTATFKTKAVQQTGTVQFRVAKVKWAPAYKVNLGVKVTSGW